MLNGMRETTYGCGADRINRTRVLLGFVCPRFRGDREIRSDMFSLYTHQLILPQMYPILLQELSEILMVIDYISL